MELTVTNFIVLTIALLLFVGSAVFTYALLAVNCHERDDKQIYDNEIKNKAPRATNETVPVNLIDNYKKIEPCPVCHKNLGISVTNHSDKKTIIHHKADKRSQQC